MNAFFSRSSGSLENVDARLVDLATSSAQFSQSMLGSPMATRPVHGLIWESQKAEMRIVLAKMVDTFYDGGKNAGDDALWHLHNKMWMLFMTQNDSVEEMKALLSAVEPWEHLVR